MMRLPQSAIRIRSSADTRSDEMGENLEKLGVALVSSETSFSGSAIKFVSREAIETMRSSEPRLFDDQFGRLAPPDARLRAQRYFGGFARGKTVDLTGVWPGVSIGRANWLRDAINELSRIDGLSSDTVRYAREVLTLCARHAFPEPSIEGDDGSAEIYFKSAGCGLLMVVKPDDLLQIFGDDIKEQWRARYKLSGKYWQSFLSQSVREFIKHDEFASDFTY